MLEGLIERVERAREGSRELDLAIDLFARPDEWAKVVHDNPDTVNAHWCGDDELPRYTASLDAAMTLVPEGWSFDLRTFATAKGALAILHPGSGSSIPSVQERAATPALTLCAASLRARLSS